jgi:quinol-cytochrome oxidoreductase complex cytochrome b subunit
MKNDVNESGLAKFSENLISLKDSFLKSFLRSGKPTSDKSRAAVMFNNFFLHIQGVKTHINSLRPNYTFGLGLISFFLLVIAFVSGIFLMVYYNPSTSNAFNTVKDINFVVSGGRFMRNLHKWSGEAMIIAVFLHMARVFFTGSYAKGRQFNWVVGILLLVLTCVLNLTGYMLPWDQLSYWAMVIVANIMNSPKEITDIFGITQYFDIGGFQKELFLGGLNPGQESLTRVYLLHILLLPAVIVVVLGIHFWRIRKDGGLTRPDNFAPKESDASFAQPPDKKGGVFPTYKTYGLMELARGKTPAVDNDVENTVLSWPNLLIAELAVFMLTLAGIMVYAYYVDAPLKELANATLPENPAKAPWYFLGFQELVSFSAFMGGIVLPTMGVVGLLLIPYLDREEENVGCWFTNKQGIWVTLQSVLLAAAGLIGVLAFSINFGWFRNWWPDIPQLLIVLINPGSLWVGFLMVWSLFIIKKTGSTRMGAIALFTMAMVTYVILTYTGTELRGPNWDFYWSKSQWPLH